MPKLVDEVRLGVDVGGTFTDIVLAGPNGSRRTKVPTTPGDPGQGVIDACARMAEEAEVDLGELLANVSRFGLGTTVVTNVLATRTGRRLGLVTTEGFESVIPLARGYSVHEDGWLQSPPLLVEREDIIGVRERIDRDGVVLEALEPRDAVAAARQLVDAGVEAIVVSFLWSFRNPAHEQTAGAAIEAELGGVPVLQAAALAPVMREYERTQFALLNAYVGGALDWLGSLEDRLHSLGLRAPLVLMHSNGGAATPAAARAVPIGLAQSGPAAGAGAAETFARILDEPNVVACDMGGTSLDVTLITNGEAARRTRGRLVGQWTALTMVDVDSVGSGGGSLAWVDALGALRVGPESAGAVPGPACYGRGGERATLTDALVVLGYIDPDHFLGGRTRLDAAAALRVCAELGDTLGLDVYEAAWGMRELALVSMAKAVRARVASRGLAGADLALIGYGGCGPLFAAEIGDALNARTVALPELASVFSASGAATSVLRRERAQSVVVRLPADSDALAEVCASLRRAALDDLVADGVDPAAATVGLEFDMRFERQRWELGIPVAVGAIGGMELDLDRCLEEFRDEYARRFGQGALASGVAVEIVTARAVAAERRPDPPQIVSTDAKESPPVTPKRWRDVRLLRGVQPTQVPVFERDALEVSDRLCGPALIDASDTTIWVPPARDARVDPSGALIIAGGEDDSAAR